MHVLFAEGFADWDYLRRYTDCPDELAAHLQTRTPEWAAAITGLPVATIVEFARLYGRTQAQLHPLPSRLLALAQRRGQHARGRLPAGRHRRLAAQGRRRAVRPHRHLPARPHADRRPRRGGSLGARARPVAPRTDPHRRCRGAEGRAAGDGAAGAEHQPGHGLPRARTRCTPAWRARTCSPACTSSS